MEIKSKAEGFKSTTRASLGLALIFDISGFTLFFNKPDIHYYMTDYINNIIDAVEVNIWGGEDYYNKEAEGDEYSKVEGLKVKPSLRKFLGDGMLYVWEDEENNYLVKEDFKVELINRLWNLQKNFSIVNTKINEKIPVGDLPQKLKFGLAQGSVFKLIEADNSVDYIGPCINLASRLVKYCPEIDFIASARINLSTDKLNENGYIKIIAKELRSFENDIVIVDKNDFKSVSPENSKRLFKEIK